MNGDDQPALGERGTRQDFLFYRMLDRRLIFIDGVVTDEMANTVCSALLYLAEQDPKEDIQLYINSPGGSVYSGLAIYDTMQYVECDVATVCIGLAASMGQFLLAAGAPGKRVAFPHSMVMMHQPSGGVGGSAADIRIQAEQLSYMKRVLFSRIAAHSGQDEETIVRDADRDRWFSAQDALEYGFVDKVVSSHAEL